MKYKEPTLKDKVKGYIVMNYHFMEFKIRYLREECKRGKISKDYFDGYLKGVTDFKDALMEANMSIIK